MYIGFVKWGFWYNPLVSPVKANFLAYDVIENFVSIPEKWVDLCQLMESISLKLFTKCQAYANINLAGKRL